MQNIHTFTSTLRLLDPAVCGLMMKWSYCLKLHLNTKCLQIDTVPSVLKKKLMSQKKVKTLYISSP